jgi:hypothetical protein
VETLRDRAEPVHHASSTPKLVTITPRTLLPERTDLL